MIGVKVRRAAKPEAVDDGLAWHLGFTHALASRRATAGVIADAVLGKLSKLA